MKVQRVTLKAAIYSSVCISEISPSNLRLVLNEFSLGTELAMNSSLEIHFPSRSKTSIEESHSSEIHVPVK